eukprot:gnl/TRDRNA2_/TRDRNA2_51822_c0_seq1.p1 gnl/TRDRNA2_/TRDRNA2_51822_c0~~gnl/TRDRNA2_/TRDRNA2_51822_c0_seq1.p1  ORF type:complete len:463 (+),score=84.00 gnl/TRDRNA2_/TRDRNA2_51822_c0_seq1:96-1484(+)
MCEHRAAFTLLLLLSSLSGGDTLKRKSVGARPAAPQQKLAPDAPVAAAAPLLLQESEQVAAEHPVLPKVEALEVSISDSSISASSLSSFLYNYLPFLEVYANRFVWQPDVFPDDPNKEGKDPGANIFEDTEPGDWYMLAVTVVCLLLVDFVVLRKLSAESVWSNLAVLGFWLFVGGAYNIVVACRKGHEAAFHWCSGYVLEWLLSLDNLFVFHLIFRVYSTPKCLLHKALFWGILGAVVFRMCFFMAITSLLHLVHWFRFVFGGLLIYSGIQAAREEDEDCDVTDTTAVRILKQCLGSRLTERYDEHGQSLFVRDEDGRVQATLLVFVILCLEVTDILFAVDSVSAKVAQIPNYYLAYSSSVIAIFGLRAMFFIVNDLVEYFHMLKYGLCFILVFIGLELVIADWVKLPAQVVLIVILSVFAVCAAASVTLPNKGKSFETPSASPANTPCASPGRTRDVERG